MMSWARLPACLPASWDRQLRICPNRHQYATFFHVFFMKMSGLEAKVDIEHNSFGFVLATVFFLLLWGSVHSRLLSSEKNLSLLIALWKTTYAERSVILAGLIWFAIAKYAMDYLQTSFESLVCPSSNVPKVHVQKDNGASQKDHSFNPWVPLVPWV